MLQDAIVLGLLYSEAGQSLLNILGTGVDTVDKLVSLGRYYSCVLFSAENISIHFIVLVGYIRDVEDYRSLFYIDEILYITWQELVKV